MTETLVKEAMTTPMLTLDAEATVDEASRGMLEAGIKSLVVVGEACRPEGIFTSTDVLQVAADGRPTDEATIGEYMTSPVKTVDPDTSLSSVGRRMVEEEVSHLPVTDADGNGVGILTTTDVTEALSAAELPAGST
ncbi:CBS domain-containing protein [Haloplanus rallus]|jgi:CBS domain-containing protein|uniref:CBS domain-containing protein n=1 Tax=Haloplanus rallus TaxID=1816183 RepID=A0A6B9F785_9EURY|nr:MULTISPECIES: CBS domain-containing protein [Haloplanus]QGX96278.1 CBS domain-containing protein [Haloplanus rallus]